MVESRSFLYDGWNMIDETIHNLSFTLHNSYVWGLDLSGSLQGAGGVGGLLAVVSPLPLGEGQGEGSTVYLPCYDANGNVMEYLSTDGTLVAHYEYSPFGETVIQSGAMADTFAFRFSTKYWGNEAKLYYYGYRFYSPNVGRWLSRDPIGENGGLHLYGFVANRPIIAVDILGFSSEQPEGQEVKKCYCCCVDSAKIQKVENMDYNPYSGGKYPLDGHKFEFVTQLSYKKWDQNKFGDCGLEWWEKIVGVDTYISGWEQDTWRDMAGDTSRSTYLYWSIRKVSPPKPETVLISDRPGLSTIQGRTVTRTLDFKIIVTSAKGCGCPKASLTTTATQVLTMENGQVNFDKSSFTFKNPE